MTIPLTYSFTRYLAAKKSVDDRALNQCAWQALSQAVPPGSLEAPLRILEVGAGIGTMLERMLEWRLFRAAEYTAIDAQPENIAGLRARLAEWVSSRGGVIRPAGEGLLELELAGQRAWIDPQAIDLFEFIEREKGRREWDLLVANAFLDLVDIPAVLPEILQLAAPGGWFYFTINFDGLTLFEPQLDPDLDAQIVALYHRTMDERLVGGRRSGDSQAGRHLFTHLKQAGAVILAAGASDWVVFPGPNGYTGDEAYFLHFILHTVEQALRGRPEIEPGKLSGWLEARHAQAARGELVYIAHQLDFFGAAQPLPSGQARPV
jgi:SAM-dependent methyltransferase